MKPEGTLLLTRSEVAALFTIEECIAAVEEVFRLQGEGQTATPGVLGIKARDGGFHIKAGLLDLSKTYFVAKANANFPHNMKRFGLPLIQGIIVLCDGENGYPLALMDSTEITILRTGAATAVAAKYLARRDAKVATICGCGNQGKVSLRAIMKVRRLERVYAFDHVSAQAERFASELSTELGIEVTVAGDLSKAVHQSDVCVTCTPSRQYFLTCESVGAGTFVAGVGADNEHKQELDPSLMQKSKIVVDLLEQCILIGDLHHAIEQGFVTREDVHAELGEVVAGRKQGRTSDEEIIVFDSTGMALQDVIAAATVYERAVSAGHATTLNFFA
jgi:ornithine cyclodeaminase/alanine dehydrogenase